MKRLTIGLVGLAIVAGASSAQTSAASSNASCVATITSFEASQLDPGSVGAEVSGLATAAPGLGSSLVSGLAKEHAGSLEACRAAEES